LTALSARLEAEGASAEALKTIGESPKYSRAGEFVAQVAAETEDAVQQLTDLASFILVVGVGGYEGAVDFEEIAALQKSISEARQAIATEVTKAKDQLSALLLRQGKRRWRSRPDAKRSQSNTPPP
jgi:chromosome segregation protein